MSKTTVALVGIVILSVAVLGAWSVPQAPDPAVLLRAAIEKEEVDGNLDAAIEQYKQIIKVAGANRAVAAQALLRLGGCYERRGPQEARKIYEQLIRDYGEQSKEVAAARQRLAALAKNAEPQKPTWRRIRVPTKLPAGGSGKLAPDGQTLAYIEGGSLWTLPVHGKSDPNIAGAPIRLTEPMHAWDRANVSIEWTADGKWIGFLVEVRPSDGSLVEELYVVPAAGGTPRRAHVRSELWAGGAWALRYALSAGADVLYFAAGKEVDDLRIYSTPTSTGDVRALTPLLTAEPALSPDGSKIAYVKGKNVVKRFVSKEIWVASTDGTAARLVYRLPDESLDEDVRGPVWSPDGRMLAFLTGLPRRAYTRILVLAARDGGGPAPAPASFDLPVGPNGTESLLAGWTKDNRIAVLTPAEAQSAIYRIPATGGKAVQLTPRGGSGLAWAPDTKRIYFLGFHGGDGIGLEAVPAEGGAVERIPLGGGYGNRAPDGWMFNGEISVAPDGQSICFGGAEWGDRNTLSLGIFSLSVRGGRPTRLTTHGDWNTGADAFPVWSPDGTRIAFLRAHRKSGVANVIVNAFVIPRDGGEARQVTTDADRVALSSLAWSPDGRAIAFSSSDKTLRIVPAAGGASRIIAEVAGSGLTWSPDGEMLAYAAAGALWRVPAAGGAPTRIETGLDARLEKPVWSPDGKSITFSGTSGGRAHELWLMEDFLHLVKTTAKK